MKIPGVNDFGNTVLPVAPRADTSAVDQATITAGATLSRIGGQAQADQIELIKKRSADREALAREKDANAYLDHQVQVKQLESDYTEKIASGEIPYEQAQQKFTEDVNKLPAPTPLSRGKVAQENLNHGVQLTIQQAQISMGNKVDAARQQDLRSQGFVQLDTLGKLAGQPDADINQVNAQADAVTPLLRRSGMNEAEAMRTVQNFKDQNWYNQATQTAMQSRNDLGALKKLETDLTAADGFYAGKLDTDKRNAVLSQVITHRIQLENKNQMQGDRRDAKAERALNQIDQQTASGVPATAEMWSDWTNTIKGTSYEDQLRDRIDSEREVQSILRQPIADQLKFVQDKESSLTSEGGSIREATNLGRLKTAVQRNITLLQQSPLLFNANRTGQDVEPLDVEGLLTGDAAVSHQIADRMATIKAMQKQYGVQVPSRPLLPQETQLITGMLDKATPDQQSQIFAGLSNAVGDTKAYMGVMQQIAPDAPVKALAGMLAAKDAELTTSHWFKPSDSLPSAKVSETMLQGLELISPTKSEKGQDGKPKVGLYLPSDNTLQADFQNTVGTAFAGRPSAAENAFQAVKAYYVGRAAQTGRVAASNQDIDSKLVKESIRATLGDVIDYNGKGNVLAPWGMDSSTFSDRVHAALISEGTKRGFSADAANALRNVGLRNLGDGTYYVTQGNNFVTDPHGHPLIIDVTQ